MPKTVTFKQVSTIAMVAGNEKKFSTVIHDGQLKQWVGFGWVDKGKATKDDLKRYPKVV